MVNGKSHEAFYRKPLRIGSAALTLALVTSMTPSFTASGLDRAMAAQPAQAAPAALPMAPTADQNQIIDADMIASGRVKKAANLTDAQGVGKGLISGHVYMATPGGNPGAAYDNGNVKMDGITVYAQFRDKDGSYSPIFSAKTHSLPDVVGGNGGKGTFAFGTGKKGITWTDKLGKEHTWAARTDQKHRIWVEPFTNERGNKVVMFRQANGFVPGSFNGLVEAPLGSFGVADANIELMAAFLQEVPPNHETSWMAAKGDKLVEDPEGPINLASTQTKVPNTISGRVWLESGGPDKGIVATGPSKNGIDEAADGYTVYASTLTKDGAAANQKLHEQYKNDPSKLADATKKMLEDHPEYILKTVHGKTDNEGNYTLRFGKYEKGQEREDVLNPNHVFVWVENKDGVVQNGYTGFHTPIFQRFNDGGGFRASAVPGENQLPINWGNGIGFQNLNSLYNVNYAIMPYTPVSITADYNATDKPAAPGTTVTPEFNGDLSSLPSKIEWRDKTGKVVKTCELDQSKSVKAQVAACTFDIPADAKKGDVFNVVVVSGGNDVAAWSVLVTDKASEQYEPGYEDGSGKPGSDVKIDAPEFKDKDGKDAKAPEGTKFAPGANAPEGVKVDPNTGEITVPIPEGAKPGDKITVPVVVTYPDGTKDTVDVTVTVTEKDAGLYEPKYEDKLVVPGKETKSSPTFTGKDGKDAKAPAGSKFSIPEDFKAPEGYEVKIDESTGEITVTFPDGSKLNKDTVEQFDVPVTVTYPDGSKDDAKANFKLDTDGDGTPDNKDEDDDNDGIPDESDSNPKVPNANDHFEPGYKDGSGKPGSDVKIDAPTFKDKDGKDAKAPEGTKFAPGANAPEGVKVDPNTGEITVPIPEGAKPGDKITVPVVVTYPDGTKDTVDVTVTVTEKDAGLYEPKYEDKLVVPGKETKSSPTFTGKDGKDAKAPAGSKFSIPEDFKAPEGYEVKIDESTGEITVTFPDGSKLNKDTVEQFDVPVTVTYPDGSKDDAKANFKLDTDGDGTPDNKDDDDDNDGYTDKQEEEKGSNPKDKGSIPATPLQPGNPTNAATFEPAYEGKLVVPGEETKSSPTFTDKDGSSAKAPEGSKFKITDGFTAPEGYEVKIDESTGEITVKFPDGSKLNKDTVEEFDVPVTVTYPDETTDEVKANFKLDTDGDGTPDTTDEDDDNDGIPDKDEKDKGSNPKDKGSIPATPLQPGNPTDAATVEPGYEDGSGKPGSDVKIDAPKFTDKDGKDTKAPEGTKFTPGENAPEGVTVDEKTGEITVPVPEDAKPGDKITVPVDVTYPDGSKDHVDVTVTVDEPDAPAEKPDWNDDKGQPGDKVEIPNTGGPVEDGTTVETEGPGKAEIGEDGKIIVDIDKDAKPGDKVVVIVKDKDGNEIDRVVVEVEKPADKPETKPDWKDNSGKPGENVVIPNEGGKVPEGSTVETEGPGKAEIDEDGNLVVDINDDAKPGDKVVVIVKDKDGNEIDRVVVEVEKPEAPAEKPAPEGNDNGTAQPKPGASNGNAPVKKVPLPRTGAEVAGVAGAAAALIAAGLGLVFSRRRHEGEEN